MGLKYSIPPSFNRLYTEDRPIEEDVVTASRRAFFCWPEMMPVVFPYAFEK